MFMQRTLILRPFLRFMLVVLSVSVLAACSSREIDEEELPAELVKFKPAFKIKRVWSKSVGDETEKLRLGLRPVSDGTNIYGASHDGRVVAVTADKGRNLWKKKTRLPLSGGPGTNGLLVVAGSSDGDLIALNAASGEELWRITVTSEVLSMPVIAGDRVVVRTVNGKLSAYSSVDGSQLWSVQQSNPRLTVRGTSSPVLARNFVLSGFDNGRVSAFDLNDGGLIWDVLVQLPGGRTEIERLSDINSTVQVAGSDVYAVGYQGKLAAIAIESGQLLWAREMSSNEGLAVDISSLFITNQRSELVAVSRGSGRELWRKSELRNRDLTAPAILGRSVVVGDFEGYLHWFDIETGDLQARTRAGKQRITSQPMVLNDTLYVISDNGRMYAFRVKPAK